MKRAITNITLLVLVGPLLTTAFAQKKSGKNMMKQKYHQQFNPSTVETIEGQVVKISYTVNKKKNSQKGVHMTVKTSDGTMTPVHLGPAWYLEQQEEINKGDEIVITGSRITFEGKPAIVAAEITRGQMTLQLRNKQGIPAWRGWRQNKRMN